MPEMTAECPATGWCFEHMTRSRERCAKRAAAWASPPSDPREEAYEAAMVREYEMYGRYR